MSGWWRRNRGALLALGILVPVTVGVFCGWEWWKTASGQPTFAVTAQQGESIDLGGVTFGPARVTKTTIADTEIPAGTKILAVRVPVDRHGGVTGCQVYALRELDGRERVFEADTALVPWDYNRYTLCPMDPEAELFPAGPFSIDVPFIVPDDVDGPLGVELLIVDELPRYARLVVVP